MNCSRFSHKLLLVGYAGLLLSHVFLRCSSETSTDDQASPQCTHENRTLLTVLNLYLDGACGGVRRRLERLHGIFQTKSVRDEPTQVDDAALDQADGRGPCIAIAVLELQIDLARAEPHEGNLHFVFADANDEDFAAELDSVDCAYNAALDAGTFHGNGRLDAVREGDDGVAEVVCRVGELDFVRENGGHKLFGKGKSSCVNVGDDERCGARGLTA